MLDRDETVPITLRSDAGEATVIGQARVQWVTRGSRVILPPGNWRGVPIHLTPADRPLGSALPSRRPTAADGDLYLTRAEAAGAVRWQRQGFRELDADTRARTRVSAVRQTGHRISDLSAIAALRHSSSAASWHSLPLHSLRFVGAPVDNGYGSGSARGSGRFNMLISPHLGQLMIMMDDNSDEVAARIQGWMERRGLMR